MTAAVQVPQVPPLAHIAGVELIHTGQWDISNMAGWVVTTDDVAAAVAAMDCPAVRRPVLKLGHTDPRFDGEPAVGWIDNLAAADSGHTLLGDYVGMPGWLGEVIASAYPDRSIEGIYDFECQIGHVHPFVLEAVALLGVSAPGIGTLTSLQDVAALYGVAATRPDPDQAGGTPVTLTVRAARGGSMPNPRPTQVAASVTTEDVRRKYYDDAPWSMWIEEVQLEPLQLIVVDDSTGKRQRVPVVIGDGDGEDAVTFGEGVTVVIRYEDVPAETGTAAASAPRVLRYASRAESRPGSPRATTDPSAPADPNPTERSTPVELTDDQLTTLRGQLGLGDDADADTLVATIVDRLTQEPATAPAGLPDGVVTIESSQLAELQVAARAGAEAHARQQREDRERLVAAAVQDGRIAPARRDNWLAQLAADPGAADVLAKLAPGTIPVQAKGYTGGPADADDDLYASVFGKEG